MSETSKTVILFFTILVVLFGCVWFTSSQEAVSYRKFCDKPVTTWDAVFLDLRIDECKPKSDIKEGD